MKRRKKQADQHPGEKAATAGAAPPPEARVEPADGKAAPPEAPPEAPAEASAEAELASLRAERDELRDKLLRARAECANVSKRLNQQHSASLKLAGMGLARSLLPVVDSLERTLGVLEESSKEDPVAEGVRLITQEFEKAFRDQGIVPIEALGKPFDPRLHEAMMQDHASDLPPGTVTRELQRGYTMHDRVLRPAKVAVAAEKEREGDDDASATETEPGPGRPGAESAAGPDARADREAEERLSGR